MRRTDYRILFFISKANLDGVTLYPRVPDNELTRNGKENSIESRICMSPYVEGCLRSITTSPLSQSWNVYIPSKVIVEQYAPTEGDVPDIKLTNEIWVKEPVTLRYFGRLDVHARVDIAPAMSCGSGDDFCEVSLFNYSLTAKSNHYNNVDIVVVDEEDDDPMLRLLVPTDFYQEDYGMSEEEFMRQNKEAVDVLEGIEKVNKFD